MDEPRVLWKNRSAGLLLHPSSLPGRYGIGDFGPLAYAWVDALARARQKWWQILPLCPTGIGDSPYQSPSTFAGNTNLLSPDAHDVVVLPRVGEVAATGRTHDSGMDGVGGYVAALALAVGFGLPIHS